MPILIAILKFLALFFGSIAVSINLEFFTLRIAKLLGLRKLYDRSKTETATEFVIFFLIIFSILFSFSLTGIAFNYFSVGGRIWAYIFYFLLDMNNSILSVLGLTRNSFSKQKIVYDSEEYPIFAGRLVGFVCGFVLYIMGVV